ncbi:hypothetical protein [Microbacterium sp. CFBP9034]|uniref:hypothetical protein n=1 Tax=Microbacterium sp. CFBP9034 TaxID=3096540 RepID=UPI002A69C3D9|nr:hypothetical protein [Microbacterium sp. CFBP9034]MDY0910319.1 hypothetical protein [Microbacterium sp. CFBP9034]
MTSADLPDEETARSVRPRANAGATPVEEATVLSARRRGVDEPADDVTPLSTRPRPVLEPEADDTAPSSRRQPQHSDDVNADTVIAPPRRRALAEDADDTVLSRRPAPSGADTVPELEDTLMRPNAPASRPAIGAPAAPAEQATAARDAHVPDAAALRVPVPPRAVPTVAVVRTSQASPSSLPDRSAAVPDHESLEGAVRGRERRRVLIVGLSTVVVAVAAAFVLVLLLT